MGLSGCATLGWYGQAARGQMEIMAKREPIVALIEDPQTDSALAKRLALVLEARQFAVDALHLPDNRSYTEYADLGRDAVVWNVVAAPAFSLAPKTWCYPIAGCLAYRGYFRRNRAQVLAEKLARRGWDVQVAPVPAYSTLGRFRDPVLNTMMHWSDARLAGLIFHELAHQRVYVRGETDFNESYATFVEQQGTWHWLQVQGGDTAAWEHELEMGQAFRAMVLQTRDRLTRLYATDLPEPEMRAAKAAVIAALKTQYQDFKTHFGGDGRYDAWMAQPINNAHLALFAAYESGVEAFSALFAQARGDWAAFHRAVEELAGADAATRTKFLDTVE